MDKPAFPTVDTEKMMRLPMGVISPLWLMFAGAATMGAAFYWSRSFFKPTNLEALTALPEAVTETVADPVPEAAVEPAEAAVEAAPEAIDVVDAPVETVEPEIEAAVEAVVEAAPEPVAPALPDDLTILTGIGPKLAAAFAERGVTRFAHIAAWTEEDIVRFDKELKLMGRVHREAWIAQATRLAAR